MKIESWSIKTQELQVFKETTDSVFQGLFPSILHWRSKMNSVTREILTAADTGHRQQTFLSQIVTILDTQIWLQKVWKKLSDFNLPTKYTPPVSQWDLELEEKSQKENKSQMFQKEKKGFSLRNQEAIQDLDWKKNGATHLSFSRQLLLCPESLCRFCLHYWYLFIYPALWNRAKVSYINFDTQSVS